MEQIRVIIADDSDFVRDGMRVLLEIDNDFVVAGCACNGKEAVELARSEHADVILMDIEMPVMDGIEATRQIVMEDLGRVLILTTFDDYELLQQAMQNGAKGYLIKNHTPDQLKQMIQSIYHGVGVMEEGLMEKLAGAATPQMLRCAGFRSDLYTKREMDIVEAVASGLSNKEIADQLFLSEGTVKNYISTILEKEGLAHRTQLAIYYLTGKK